MVTGVASLATQTPTISSSEKINMAPVAKTDYAQRKQFQMNSHKQAKENQLLALGNFYSVLDNTKTLGEASMMVHVYIPAVRLTRD